jgi:hypothetical protein
MKSMVVVLALAISAQAVAQLPTREQMIASAVKDYAALIGGEALNGRCKVLSDEKTAAYRADIEVITPALEKDIGNPALLDMLRTAAATEAGSDKYTDCGPQVLTVVEAASTHAANWADGIRKFQAVGATEFVRSLEKKMQDTEE